MLKALGLGVKCPQCDHTLPPVRAPTSFGQAMHGGWTCKHCACEIDRRGREKVSKRRSSAKIAEEEPVVHVRLDPNVERVQVGAEEVNVPAGVNIKVTRTRTIEHTVELSEKTQTTLSSDAGIASGVFNMKLSIAHAIEKQQGRTYSENETMEYQVELHGDQESSKYTLLWTEHWRTGVAEVEDKRGRTIVLGPIRFREGAALEVQRDDAAIASTSEVSHA
jgi:hypothetical protein